MDAPATLDLLQRARAIAQDVVGTDVDVDIVETFDVHARLAYEFSILLDPARTPHRPGHIRIRLLQRLREELEAQDDPHRPLIRLFDQKDWPLRRVNARPV